MRQSLKPPARMLGTLAATLAATAVACGLAAPLASAATSPTVTTGAATHDTQSSATLHGAIDPGGARTTYYFQWGPTAAFGSTTAPATLASGTKTISVTAGVVGLIPGTTYYYRLVAGNSAGQGLGATRTFKTQGNPPPGAATGGAQAIGRSTATLTGVVYPNNETTTFFFQYGLSTAYDAQTLPQSVGGTAPVSVSASLSGLEPGTVFHYRLVVEHQNLTTQSAGGDSVFETIPSPRPRPSVSASTAPRRTRVPATFTTAGRLRRPAAILATAGCVGRVRITFSLGRRAVGMAFAPVQPNCAFAADQTFRRLPGRGARGRTVRMVVRVRFLGNAYLAPSSARNETVVLR